MRRYSALYLCYSGYFRFFKRGYMTSKKQYSNDMPPWKDKTWQYGQYNHIMQRFKALGFVPPSEKRAKE